MSEDRSDAGDAQVARSARDEWRAAFEAAGSGIDWTFSPMVDVARDQRWGRGVEGGGEDVLLEAYVHEP